MAPRHMRAVRGRCRNAAFDNEASWQVTELELTMRNRVGSGGILAHLRRNNVQEMTTLRARTVLLDLGRR